MTVEDDFRYLPIYIKNATLDKYAIDSNGLGMQMLSVTEIPFLPSIIYQK